MCGSRDVTLLFTIRGTTTPMVPNRCRGELVAFP